MPLALAKVYLNFYFGEAMTKTLRIEAPHFRAEARIKDGVCIKAAPNIRSFRKKSEAHIVNECNSKKWRMEFVEDECL